MDYSPPGSSSMGFSRQEYWSGFPCLPPGDLPDPGIEPRSLMSPVLAGRFFTTSIMKPTGAVFRRKYTHKNMQLQGFLNNLFLGTPSPSWDHGRAKVQGWHDSRRVWEQEHSHLLLFLVPYSLIHLSSLLSVNCGTLENFHRTKKELSRILWLQMTFTKLRLLHEFLNYICNIIL